MKTQSWISNMHTFHLQIQDHVVSCLKQLKLTVCAMKLYKYFLLRAGENQCTNILFSFLNYFDLQITTNLRDEVNLGRNATKKSFQFFSTQTNLKINHSIFSLYITQQNLNQMCTYVATDFRSSNNRQSLPKHTVLSD